MNNNELEILVFQDQNKSIIDTSKIQATSIRKVQQHGNNYAILNRFQGVVLFELNKENCQKFKKILSLKNSNKSFKCIVVSIEDVHCFTLEEFKDIDFLYIIQLDIDYDFLNKLIKQMQLLLQIKENNNYKSLQSNSYPSQLTLPGKSLFIQNLNKKLQSIANSDAPILISGPTGVGKSYIAQLIHRISPFRDREPVVLDCHTINANLIESELFGFTRGAFTGAFKEKKGKFFYAHNNTLILEEISGMPTEMQAKLLQVLDTKTFTPLGSNREIESDFRLISTTNFPLSKMHEGNIIRQDFLFRINVIPIVIPPLFERKEDIVLYFNLFLKEEFEKKGIEPPEIDEGFLHEIMHYPWPGNLKEMKNFIKRLSFNPPRKLMEGALKLFLLKDQIPSIFLEKNLLVDLNSLKRFYVNYVVHSLGLSKKEAAEKLKIDIKTLNKYLSK